MDQLTKKPLLYSLQEDPICSFISSNWSSFLPTYNDFQFKSKTKINEKNQITLIGLGAIDDFVLNTGINDNILAKENLTLDDSLSLERNNYILGYLPVSTQWNYATGVNGLGSK